jgi:ParB-like chromosome segregation protein Spo0J
VTELESIIAELARRIDAMPFSAKVEAINQAREALHNISPFASEPVDFVRWVASDDVFANDYNPNSVAPPEMELLRRSVMADGYTQPIVTHFEPAEDGRLGYCVVDGFHRNRVGKECADVQKRVKGYLPVVKIRESQEDRGDRIASTIRHNRARGKHKVEAMSDIVIELKRRNWSDEKIGRELGMDPDEVLRLCQITGLAEAFKDEQFSQAWEVVNDASGGAELISDVIDDYQAKDGERILHTWDKWECYKAGFYAERPPGGMSQEDGESAYRTFLSDLGRFEAALQVVTQQWKFSPEHYLTNERMNRIAWLGQASVAQALGIPSGCRAGYQLLTDDEKYAADMMALKYLNRWLTANGRHQLMRADAVGRTEAELY